MKNLTSDSEITKLNKAVKKATAYFKPPEQMTVTEWADKYRWLSAENSAEPGRWKTSRTPYLKEIMDAFTDPKIHRIAVCGIITSRKNRNGTEYDGVCHRYGPRTDDVCSTKYKAYSRRLF